MTRYQTISAITVAILLAGTGGYFLQQKSAPLPADSPSSAADEISAAVKTQAMQKQTLRTQLSAYGEVMTGKVEGVSFPRAGQVSGLLVTLGQSVKRGTPLATLSSDPNVQMAFKQASSAVHYAQGELKRNQDLFALQLATQAQVDNASKALRDAEDNLAAQKKLGGDVSTATVNAPFDGVVTALAVAQGDRLQPGATILQLGHTDALRIQLGIEPDDARQVRAGTPVTVSPVQDEKHSLQSSIALVQDLLDPKTQLINAIVILPPQVDRFLVPGMKVRASLDVGQHEAWVLPRQAVLSDDKGDYIFQVDKGKARRVAVVRGQQSHGLVALSGPIAADQPAVVLGNYELQDGMKVRESAR